MRWGFESPWCAGDGPDRMLLSSSAEQQFSDWRTPASPRATHLLQPPPARYAGAFVHAAM